MVEESAKPFKLAADLAACEAFGHHASSDSFAEYPDGLIAARCERCNKRITMNRVPGGLPLLRAQRLVSSLLDGNEGIVNLMAIGELEDLILAEKQRIEEAQSLVALARRLAEHA